MLGCKLENVFERCFTSLSHRFAVPADPSTILREISQEELDSWAQQQWWNMQDCQHFWKTWCLFYRLVVFLCLGSDREGKRHLVSQVSVLVVKRTAQLRVDGIWICVFGIQPCSRLLSEDLFQGTQFQVCCGSCRLAWQLLLDVMLVASVSQATETSA